MDSRLLSDFAPQVKHNCNISDSRYWGFFSICGLLLRLRELYRAEHSISPWESHDERGLTGWIGRREDLWRELGDEDFRPLRIGAEEFGPFEVGRINRALGGTGLIYGAGYGLYGKPVFFLAGLESHEPLDGFEVFTCGREYARGLSIHPAMLQGKSIFARKAVSELLVWEKFEELRAKKAHSALSVAFSSYGVDPAKEADELQDAIREVSDSELRTFIHHELGEAYEAEKTGPAWDEMLLCMVHSRASVFVRALKDTLADTSERGMLSHIIEERKTGSLAFYVASLGGYMKSLACGMSGAFEEFMRSGDWGVMEEERHAVYKRAFAIAEDVLGVYGSAQDTHVLRSEIERRLIPRQRR